MHLSQPFGIVVIGRNEGKRLEVCLQSANRQTDRIVYVDSGSSDDSLSVARSCGAHTVRLDVSRPFTAARARNAGFESLLNLYPDTRFVQFVDGDCQLADGWLTTAMAALEQRPNVAVVCGRRRERFPSDSFYNLLCDMEWNTPIGDTAACGGDALMRADAFRQVGGFNPNLIAGEEPELCVRMRQAGFIIHRLDAEMALHDAAIDRFSQWWKRSLRSGHAYAEGAYLHGRSPQRHWLKQTCSALMWGGLFPLLLLILLAVGCWNPIVVFWSAAIPVIYVVQFFRIVRHRRRRGDPIRAALLYAAFCVLGKLPQCLGVFKFHVNRLTGRRAKLVEYKAPQHST